MPKLRETQFYSVGDRRAVTASKDDIRLVMLKNKKAPGKKIPALYCKDHGLYKFVKRNSDNVRRLKDKYN